MEAWKKRLTFSPDLPALFSDVTEAFDWRSL